MTYPKLPLSGSQVDLGKLCTIHSFQYSGYFAKVPVGFERGPQKEGFRLEHSGNSHKKKERHNCMKIMN